MFSRYLAGISVGTALALASLAPLTTFAEDAKTVEVDVKPKQGAGIKLTVPEDWKQKEGSVFRLAQFDVPAAEGDKEAAELVVFHFGQSGGGGVSANIDRWTKQFDADGRKLKIFEGESKQGKYTLVELTGTWNKPIGPPIQGKTAKAPGSRVLNAILHTEKGGDFFIRLSGLEKTVADNAKTFRASFGGDAEKEKEREQAAEQKE